MGHKKQLRKDYNCACVRDIIHLSGDSYQWDSFHSFRFKVEIPQNPSVFCENEKLEGLLYISLSEVVSWHSNLCARD